MHFPRLYAIADIDVLAARDLELASFATGLRDAGVTLLQYRNKQGPAQDALHDAATLKAIRGGSNIRLIMNDRADLALLAGFDGVHVGQDDLTPQDAWHILGLKAWVGVSTHSPQQVIEAETRNVDYVAYGPVFPTATKSNPDPTVGLAGLRLARSHTTKPLVAIGGITLENFRSVIDAGCDSVAIISGLLPTSANGSIRTTRQIAEEFLVRLA